MTDKKTTQTFNQVPTDILDNKELSLLDKFIYGEVFTMSVQGKEFFMSNARLAERYNVTIRTIKRSMKSLKDLGLVTIKMYRNEQKMVTKRSVSVVTSVTPPSDMSDTTLVTPVTRIIDQLINQLNILVHWSLTLKNFGNCTRIKKVKT